jgi:4-amino-4-deoxy-L-arabinose transferase-like glycosyltransferase
MRKTSLFVILSLSLILRLALFSGDGLGDDANYFASYHRIFQDHQLIDWDYDYRVFFWLPILSLWHVFGVSEYSWIIYITLCSVGTVALAYFILKEWYGASAGLIGAGLMAVNPFDVTFSTLFAVDIPMTFYMGLSLLFFIQAQRKEYSTVFFSLSAAILFVGYSTKMLAYFMLPVYGIFMLFDWKNTRKYLSFWLVLAGLMLVYMGVLYFITGDFLAHLHAQIKSGGFGALNKNRLMDYLIQMFGRAQYGRFFHGFYFHLAGLCLIFWLWFRKEAARPFIYLGVVFLLTEFMPHNYEDGTLLTIQRIYRYLAPLVLPCVLFISFFWWKLFQKSRSLFYVFYVPFILISLYHAMDLSHVTRDAFSDPRDAAAFIVTLPEKPVYSDWHITSHLERFSYGYKKPHLVRPLLNVENDQKRVRALHAVREGYVVTGGARLPYYGCLRCINRVGGMEIPGNWILLKEFNKPLNEWRKEPLRVWEVGRGLGKTSSLNPTCYGG